VHLPGVAAPERVGHGRHHWDVADPAPARRPVRTVRDALDDAALWNALTGAVAELAAGSGATTAVDTRIGRYLDRPVAELAPALAPPGLVPNAEKVHERIAEILSRAR
jgi:alpha-L-rhamnosidase